MKNLAIKERVLYERECVHRQLNTDGNLFTGTQYIKALQRLRSDEALKASRNVGAFFWADAPRMTVWLCENCARDIGL